MGIGFFFKERSLKLKQYQDLLHHVQSVGTLRPNRTGIDTISTFHYSYVVDLREGFPLLTAKKINFDNILFELLWFLSGDCKIDWLHKHGIRFWDDWIEDGKYLPEAYGKFWRSYPVDEMYWSDGFCKAESDSYWGFDQFRAIIDSLKNPDKRDSRRLCLTNWYPPSAWNAKLPPCHLFSIFNVQYDKDGEPNLNLEMLQRSCDVPVGVPFNLASYGLLLELVGHLTGIPARMFGHTLVDAHIYVNQEEGVKKYLSRTPGKLPTLKISGLTNLEELDILIRDGTTDEIRSHFTLEGYEPQPFIKFPVAV